MRREYPNGMLKALRYAAINNDLESELFDAADEIERLQNELKELKRYTTKLILESDDYGKFIDWYNNNVAGGEQG
jgi:hypothetical protein